MDFGDEIKWFPMRVTYAREEQVKAFLDQVGIENYLPLHYEYIERGRRRRQVLRPAVRNLIFIHDSQKHITELKMTIKELLPLRYMVKPAIKLAENTVRHEIITVPDHQMKMFLKVTAHPDNKLVYMENLDFAGRPGKRVKVVAGDFTGIEGVIKRVKRNKCVVVQIEGVVAVAIAYIPQAFLRVIDD